MTISLDAAIARWKAAGPLSEESMKLLLELREAALTDQPQDFLWSAFVRSLSDEQRKAALALMEVADAGEAFRFF
ncbi:MAG: hypothetical protein RIC56_19290 [Pseudomonadales bacterium]